MKENEPLLTSMKDNEPLCHLGAEHRETPPQRKRATGIRRVAGLT